MDINRESSPRDSAQSETGIPTSRLPSSAPMQQTDPNYVPPELRPNNNPPYTSSSEPTRQWSAPPPPQSPPPPSGPYTSNAYVPPQPPPQNYARGDRDWRDTRYRRAPILGPFLLITAGVVFLLNNLGVLPWSIWNQLWKLWPLILILVGLEILLGRRSPALSFILILVVLAAGVGFVYANKGFHDAGNLTHATLNVPLNGASKAEVSINMGAGELNLDGNGVSSGQLAVGTLGYFQNDSAPNPSVSTSGDTAVLDLSQSDSGMDIVPFFGFHNGTLSWDAHLNPQIPMSLKVKTGAGNGDLDLSNLKITDLDVERGAGNVTVTLPSSPSSGVTTGKISGGVGNLELIVPEGVAARLDVNTGIGNVNVDGRFTKKGDNTYETSNYSSDAKNRVDLSVGTGIGNVNVSTK